MVAENDVMELDDSGHICPISREAGLPPRRSIDIKQQASFDLPLKQQQHHSSSSVGRPVSALRGDQPTVWHPSLQWSASPGCSSPTRAGHPAYQQHSIQQVQQLAAACCNRNVKQLQALLAQELPCLSDAADTAGNTALHMVLLPYSGSQAGGADPVSSKSTGTGSLSWLTGCFGGTSAGGISRAGSMRSLSGTAALQAQLQMVSALIAAGADANARNLQGLTPLMLAVQQVLDVCSTNNSLIAPALRVLEQLCKHVLLDPNMKDNQGRTALVRLLQGPQQTAAISSVYAKQQQVVHDSVRSTHGQFSRASKSAHPAGAAAGAAPAAAAAVSSAAFGMVQLKAAQILLHCGADCNAADGAGMTPLMFAAAQPTVTKELLWLLLERGANPRQLDNSRRSALTHALLANNLPLLPAVGAGSNGQPQCAACGYCAVSSAAAATDTQQAAQAQVQHQQASADSPEAAAAAGAGAGSALGLKPDAAALNAFADAMTASAVSCSAASSACDSCASPDLHAQVHTCSMYSGITAVSFSSGTAVRPNPQHSMVVRALCSYGALDLHPASINTRFPGLNNFTQLHIAMRRGDVMALQVGYQLVISATALCSCCWMLRADHGAQQSTCWRLHMWWIIILHSQNTHSSGMGCRVICRCCWPVVQTSMPQTPGATVL